MTKSNKSKVGRPEKITSEKLNHFKMFIIAGCTVKEACEQIEITPMTWRNYCKKHPDILPKFAKWKKELETKAKLNIAMKIRREKDINISIYYLERQEKLKEQAARTALNRARAKRERAQAKIAERQAQQLKQLDDSSDQAVIIDDFTDEEVSDHDNSDKDED